MIRPCGIGVFIGPLAAATAPANRSAGLVNRAPINDDNPAMPLTLYRYIARDLLKLLAVSTGALVLLLSVGSALKPISEGLLGPVQLVKVIGYTMPVMLVVALPFAAAFTVTLVFFRLNADNEIAACSASGISYRSLALPVVVLGVALTLVMFYLSNWVVPIYFEKATQLVERDFTRMFIRRIQRRQTVRWGKLVLYADAAHEIPIDPSQYPGPVKPYRRIALEGAAVGKLDRLTGNLSGHYTGERAVVDLFRHAKRVYATVKLTNATFKHPRSGTLVTIARQAFGAQELPLPLKYDPQFMSLPDLQETARRPDRHPDIIEHRQTLLDAMITVRTLHRLDVRLSADNPRQPVRLSGPNAMTYYLQAPASRVHGNRLELIGTPDEPVVVRGGRGLAVRQRLEAAQAVVHVTVSPDRSEPRLDIKLEQVTVSDQELPTPVSHVGQVYLTLLRLDEPIAAPLMDLSSVALRRVASASAYPSVQAAGRTLADRINALRREIISRVHERAATATSCMIVMLLATLLAILLRSQSPLMIFLWCFLPAIVNMVLINSGRNLMDSGDFTLLVGMAVAWSGIVLMAVMIALVYYRLSRN